MTTVAFLHPVANDCVTTDPTAYANPRELVLKHDLDEAVAALRLLARAWMHNRHRCPDDPYVPATQTYENWALTRAYCATQREAMKDALKLIAKHEGRSTFGNDWQHALEPR